MIHSRLTSRSPFRLAAGGGSMRRRLPSARGFTIIELLIVVAIIILLLGMLIVAVSGASRVAQKANTATLMNSINKGLERFRNDIGYYPPVLHALGAPVAPADALRGLLNPPAQGSGTYQADVQDWYSYTSLADYLVGWDVGVHDGYGYPAQNETPPAGIRHCDTDGVWGATVVNVAIGTANGSLASRNPPVDGKRYGPYIELKDKGLIGSTDGTYDSLGNPRVFFPGDAGYNAAGPMVICDYWGTPLRYYRRPYPSGYLSQSFRSGTDINGDNLVNAADIVPTLSDVYLLRPWTIKPGEEASNRFGDGDGKIATSRTLNAAEYALFSPGADRSFNQNVSVDAVTAPNDNQYNRDNVVEVGP